MSAQSPRSSAVDAAAQRDTAPLSVDTSVI